MCLLFTNTQFAIFYNLNSVNCGVRVEAEERVDPRASNIVDGEGRKLPSGTVKGLNCLLSVLDS
jgi:hypothetical protein